MLRPYYGMPLYQQQSMQVVRHDNKLIEFNVWEVEGNLPPRIVHDLA